MTEKDASKKVDSWLVLYGLAMVLHPFLTARWIVPEMIWELEGLTLENYCMIVLMTFLFSAIGIIMIGFVFFIRHQLIQHLTGDKLREDESPFTMKPLNRKNYSSIGHLSNSNLTVGDHYIDIGQEKFLVSQSRRGDLVIVTEKYDNELYGGGWFASPIYQEGEILEVRPAGGNWCYKVNGAKPVHLSNGKKKQ